MQGPEATNYIWVEAMGEGSPFRIAGTMKDLLPPCEEPEGLFRKWKTMRVLGFIGQFPRGAAVDEIRKRILGEDMDGGEDESPCGAIAKFYINDKLYCAIPFFNLPSGTMEIGDQPKNEVSVRPQIEIIKEMKPMYYTLVPGDEITLEIEMLDGKPFPGLRFILALREEA